MRKWLAMLAGVTAIALTGTALAMTGSAEVGDEETATTVATVEDATTTTLEEPAEPEMADEVDEPDVVWEKPDEYVPYLPGDHTPPEVEILFPEDGQVFEKNEVAFEGITEPGAKVSVGEHQADVGEDGSWRIVLHLEGGENHITVNAVDPSGNHAADSVTVVYVAPKKEEPKKEEPKKEEPKKEEPKEKEVEWEFSANQTYGECSESPPYDVFFGTGKPGSTIVVESEFARKTTEVGEHGHWEVKVIFEGAPIGEAFAVHVVDGYEHHEVFEFVHTD